MDMLLLIDDKSLLFFFTRKKLLNNVPSIFLNNVPRFQEYIAIAFCAFSPLEILI